MNGTEMSGEEHELEQEFFELIKSNGVMQVLSDRARVVLNRLKQDQDRTNDNWSDRDVLKRTLAYECALVFREWKRSGSTPDATQITDWMERARHTKLSEWSELR